MHPRYLAAAITALALVALFRPAIAQDAPNVSLIKSLYTAFGKGDIKAIVEATTEDIDWTVVGPPADCPCFGTFKGRAGVQKFFAAIGEVWKFNAFEPEEFIVQGDRVVVLGRYAMTSHKTSKSFSSDWVHIFRLRDGRVSAFKEFTDSAQAAPALRN